MAAVIQAVEELRRHEDLLAPLLAVGIVGGIGIVPGVQAVEVGPGMDHVALLGIIFGEILVDGGVPATLVAVAPEEDARVVDIACDHLRQQPGGHLVAVGILPAGQLVEVKQPQRVAGLQEMGVRGIVRAHGVHVHRLDQAGILQACLPAEGAAGAGVEAVAVGALDEEFDAVEVDAVLAAQLHGAETDALLGLVEELAVPREQAQAQPVAVRMLRVPGLHARPVGGNGLCISAFHGECARAELLAGGNLGEAQFEPFGARKAAKEKVGAQGAVRTRVDRRALDVLLRARLQVHRAVDAAEEPPVGPALRGVDRRVGRLLVHRHLELILPTVSDQLADVVGEAVEAALVHGSRLDTVDLDLGVRHHTFEDDPDLLAAPGAGHVEAAPVDAVLLSEGVLAVVGPSLLGVALVDIVAAVGVAPETLLLPAGGDVDLAPFAGVHPVGAPEIPLYGVVRPLAGEVERLGLLGARGPC